MDYKEISGSLFQADYFSFIFPVLQLLLSSAIAKILVKILWSKEFLV